MFHLGTSLAKPTFSRTLYGSRGFSFSLQQQTPTTTIVAGTRRSYSSKTPDPTNDKNDQPIDPIVARRREIKAEKLKELEFKQLMRAKFDSESQNETRFQNAEVFSDSTVLKSATFPGPPRKKIIHARATPMMSRPFHVEDLFRKEEDVHRENKLRMETFRAIQEINASYRDHLKSSNTGFNQLDLPADLMQQFALPPGALDNLDPSTLNEEQLAQMEISREQLEALQPILEKITKFNQSSILSQKIKSLSEQFDHPRVEVTEVVGDFPKAKSKKDADAALEGEEDAGEAADEAPKSDVDAEDDQELALLEEAEGADLDLEKYQLSGGNYIDAQNFLQDVSHFKVSDFSMDKRARVVEMIERARKILRSQKQDKQFWDEFLVLRQMNELTLQNDSHYRPVIHPNMKDNMYYLHMSNPQEWTIGKLAQKFRLIKVKVEAILKLKIDEHIKLKTAPWLVSEEGDEVDEAYADYFGYVAIDEWSIRESDYRMDITAPRWRRAMVSAADEEEDLAALHRANFRVQERWDEMPEQRPTTGPQSAVDILDGRLIRRSQSKYRKRPRSEHIWIDSSPVENFDETSRMFWVAKDGSMRHLTWSERVLVCKRGDFGENQWRGGLANLKTLIDPIVFPADSHEEELMKEQQKPLWKNRRFSQAQVVTEKDVLKKMDYAFGRIGPVNIPMTSYTHGRIPWSVQHVMKQTRKTNVLDTIYKPHVLLDQ